MGGGAQRLRNGLSELVVNDECCVISSPPCSEYSLVVAARVDADVLGVADHQAIAVAVTNLGINARDVLG